MARLSNRKISARRVSINKNIKNIARKVNLEPSIQKQLESHLRERFNNNKGFFKLREINKLIKSGKFDNKTNRNKIRSLLGNNGYSNYRNNAIELGQDIKNIKNIDDIISLSLGTQNLFYRENKTNIKRFNELNYRNLNKIQSNELNKIDKKLKSAYKVFNDLKQKNNAKFIAENLD